MDAVERIAEQILKDIEAEVEEPLDTLEDAVQAKLRVAAVEMADLTLRSLSGEDVEQELLILEAEIANWSFVAASSLTRAFWRAVNKAASRAGDILANFAEAALERYLG